VTLVPGSRPMFANAQRAGHGLRFERARYRALAMPCRGVGKLLRFKGLHVLPGRFPKRPGAARAPQFRGHHAWHLVCKSLPKAVATRIPAIPRDWFYSAMQFSIKENTSRRRPKP
jgi:hypothetical protein